MTLLRWALVLAILSIITGILGYGGVSDDLATVARILFFIFLAGVAILVLMGTVFYKKITGS